MTAFVALSFGWWIAFIVAALLVGVLELLAAHADGRESDA